MSVRVTKKAAPESTADVVAGLPHVLLFTDGACSGNPGPGGWGYVLRHPQSGQEREDSGGEPQTTNNRMELTAVIMGLSALSTRSRVELWSDSKYVLDGLRDWMPSWKKRGWKTADKKPVKNQDLWMALDELAAKHEITFHWVKGHSDNPDNERCDRMAVAAVEAITGKRFDQNFHLRK